LAPLTAVGGPQIRADQPFAVEFDATRTRFVRLLIHRACRGQPCVDELEVFGPDGGTNNLALASIGAKATASSCLPGYAIHQVAHLNDGKYGNDHSWISAGASGEWAQIELPESMTVARVVLSRDRKGRYRDRVPIEFEVLLSADGEKWRSVSKVKTAAAAAPRRRQRKYSGPNRLPSNPTWDNLLTYAFDCERHTWKRMSASDHLSPLSAPLAGSALELKVNRERKNSAGDSMLTFTSRADPDKGYWTRIARTDALPRTLVQMEDLIERLEAKGVAVADARMRLDSLRARQAGGDGDIPSANRDIQTPPRHPERSGAEPRDLGNRDHAGRFRSSRDPSTPLRSARDDRGGSNPEGAGPDGNDVRSSAVDLLYHDARLAKRELMFRDPELAGLSSVLFVKRHPYHASHNYSDVLDSKFRPGGGVYALCVPCRGGRWRPREATLTQLFDGSNGIARDPVADFDAGRVFFAYRPNESPREGWKPYWHLMVVNRDGSSLNQLTDGPFHDYYPCPLPDGDLAFISTRCRARFLCWRPQAFVLFRMRADGSDIRPLSFANLSEWSPRMMRDGRILWTRSEYIDKGADFGHTLWAIRPDGTHPELVFGNNTPNCYINACEVPGTDEVLCTLFSHGGDHNGPIGLVDTSKDPFDIGAIMNITPDTRPHYNMSWPRYECFRDPTPISRDYFLVSHAPGGRFGLYVIDRYGNRELLYMDPEIGCMSPTPLRPRERPPVLAGAPETGTAETDKAQLTVIDVYAGLEPHVKRGQVAYLRVCQEVRAELGQLEDGQYRYDHTPFQDWYATPIHKVRGPHGWPSYVAKASLGIVPVEPDGSVSFEVPAGKVIYFQVLDAEFNELQRMRSVLQLQPGEQRSCIGCHENRQTAPAAETAEVKGRKTLKPQPPPWGAVPFSYEAVVQPVWDKHCVRCHKPGHKSGIDFAGTLDRDKVPVSYRSLIQGGWVHYFDWTYKLRHSKAEPLTFGTLKSKLWQHLNARRRQPKWSRDEMRAVKCWIDLNCPLWPDYRFRPERRSTTATAGGNLNKTAS